MFQLSFQSPHHIRASLCPRIAERTFQKSYLSPFTVLLYKACLLKNWCSLGSSCLVFAQLVSQSVLVEQVTFFGPHAPPGTCSLMATLCFFTFPADDEVKTISHWGTNILTIISYQLSSRPSIRLFSTNKSTCHRLGNLSITRAACLACILVSLGCRQTRTNEIISNLGQD